MSGQLEYVEKLIKDDIDFFEKRRNFNRKAAFRLTILPACLSAVSTIALGIEDKLNMKWLLVVALIASGISSILGAWQSLFANKKLWAANNVTLAELYKLHWDIGYRKADGSAGITKQEIDAYYARLMKIHGDAEAYLQQAYKSE